MTKRLLPLALLSFAFLVACGDDDSSFAPHDEDSSSSICEDCDDESSSSGKETATNSSSSRNGKSSSSSTKSSSSEKENSSSSQAFVPNWEDGDDGEIRRDDSTGIAFKYDAELDQWVKAQTNDTTLNLQGCTTRREGEMHKITSRNQYYICKKSNWVLPSTLVIDTYGKNCTEAEIGTFIIGAEVDTNSYYCAASGWVSVKGRWGWDVPKEARQNQNTVYGTMTDKRDGQVYKTVKIGDQVWMAENLNYADNEKTPSIKGKSWCFGNDSTKCLVTGRLYTWAAAIDSVALANDAESPMECGFNIECLLLEKKLQGICPDGWRLPTQTDFETLFEAVGGTANAGTVLKTTTGWYYNYKDGNGTDDYGFSGLPAGGRSTEGQFSEDGRQTCFWSSVGDKSDDRRAQCMYLEYYDKESGLWNPYKNYGYPVRCVQDKDTAPSSSSEASSSSSSTKSSSSEGWNWNVPKEAYFNPEIHYDSITDKRDGKVYKIVKIGEQVWMAENLNYADSIKTPNLKGNNWCYDNDSAKCNITGRLYSWDAAIIACPENWHLPDTSELRLLFESVNGYQGAGRILKSQSGWDNGGNGIDSVGFCALPAGSRSKAGKFGTIGLFNEFWSASEYSNPEDAFALHLGARIEQAGIEVINKNEANPIRCIKD